MRLIISDLDGTLADHRHRSGYKISDPAAYFQLSVRDEPFQLSVEILNAAIRQALGTRIHIVTVRPQVHTQEGRALVPVAQLTEQWLERTLVPYTHLSFRSEGVEYKDAVTDKIERMLGIIKQSRLDRFDITEFTLLEDELSILEKAYDALRGSVPAHAAFYHVQEGQPIRLS